MSRFNRINNIISLASTSTGINSNLTNSESVCIYFKTYYYNFIAAEAYHTYLLYEIHYYLLKICRINS